MKKITVVIPTRNRWEKLQKTIDNIPQLPYLSVYIICDGDGHTKYNLESNLRPDTKVRCSGAHKGAVWCRNEIIKNELDGVLYGTDDITFLPGSIEKAFEIFNKNFLDDDGVVGFHQTPGTYDPTGVALVGQTFLQRYPGKQLFFPQYYHFSSQEVYRLCEKIQLITGKKVFVQDKQVCLEHLHPCQFREKFDTTHQEARVFRSRDLQLSLHRKQKGLVWGKV
jgi:glycosyltransferase involved in cell wall biosynthesis